MQEVKLKPCPFCGGEPWLQEFTSLKGTTKYYVECGSIECSVRPESILYETQEEAAESWNTRKPVERIVERLKEEERLSKKAKGYASVNNPLQYERCDSYLSAIGNAIEIVKEEG